MNIYQKVSVAVALSLYLPMGVQILTGAVKQNLATFFLWGALDAVAAAAIYVQGGNYQLPAAYVLGCIITILCILKARTFSWTSYETKVSFMVVFCIVAWALSGPWYATIFSTTGVVVAGLPQLKDSWLDSKKSPLLIYLGFTFANAMSVLGGKGWTVEERLYPTACVALCGLIVMASMRHHFQKVEVR